MATRHIAVDDKLSWRDIGVRIGDLDWDLERLINRDDSKGIPQQKSYEGRDEGYQSLITVINDHLLVCARLVIEGEDAYEVVAMLFRELPSELITFEQAAALAREEDPVQVARGLRYFAAMSGSQAEPRLLEEFERGLRHSDPGVRDAALQLASYNGWSEIRESVLLLKEKESHPEVLSRIDQVLAAYKKVEG